MGIDLVCVYTYTCMYIHVYIPYFMVYRLTPNFPICFTTGLIHHEIRYTCVRAYYLCVYVYTCVRAALHKCMQIHVNRFRLPGAVHVRTWEQQAAGAHAP